MINKCYDILIIGTIPARFGSKSFGGVAEVTWNLAKEVLEKNIRFCVGAIGRYYKPKQKIEGIEVYGIGIDIFCFIKAIVKVLQNLKKTRYYGLKYLIKLVYATYYLLFLSKSINYKIVHVHHVINLIPQAAKILNSNIKIIGTIHSITNILNASDDLRNREIELVNEQISFLDSVIFVSNALVHQAHDLGIQVSEYEVIHNGIDVPDSRLYETKRDLNRLFFAGSLSKYKGLDLLINTHLKYMEKTNTNLYIAGAGDLREEVEKISKTESRVHYVGYLDKDEMKKYMAAANVFVMPSQSESFGLVYLEALSMGTPVIGYPPIMSEIFTVLKLDERFRVWFQGFDSRTENEFELHKKIERALLIKKNREYPDQCQKIHSLLFNQFSWEIISEKYINQYNYHLKL